ncbi:MAG: undecaprenyldiphospho-muramoylpentapeptide beta-N-acetylglucosaminyltransferase [Thermaerobacter sp.]|nr:undecaprenyldiphospho-muramoylpentapeptide beta-N-acetylglucosaminyltransferase [Thermaerobacter sp.]
MRVLVTGGGTGGHIYPALAVAKALRDRVPGCQVLYVGTAAGLEHDLVPREGVPFRAVRAAGMVGKGASGKLRGAAHTTCGLGQSLRLVASFRPDVAVGTGGYVAAPVMLAAWLWRVPVLIQEQNVLPGATNRLLARLADRVALPFEASRRHFPARVSSRLRVVGNPVRPEVLTARREEGARRLGLDPARPTVLIYGGSRGAKALNRAGVEVLRGFRGTGNQAILITGEVYHREVGAALEREGIAGPNLLVYPYLHHLEDALAVSDLVVARAGAMTVAELTARGLPSVLIPSPNVAHHHQDANARLLARAGAAVLVRERELAGKQFAALVRELLEDRERLEHMAQQSRALGRPQALEDLVALVLELTERRSS